MTTIRLRQVITILVAAAMLTALPAAPAIAAKLRVEGPSRTIYQGSVTPFAGTLRDSGGAGHTTSKRTALGALVTASRLRGFPIGLGWSDSFGGGWNGFFINSIASITPPPTAFWALKIDQKLAAVGAGAATVTPGSNVLFYYTTFDPSTYATQPTLGISSNGAVTTPGAAVTFSVASYDDAGTRSPAGRAWVFANGVGTQADPTGHVTLRFDRAGLFGVRATKAGSIRSRTLWVRVTTSS